MREVFATKPTGIADMGLLIAKIEQRLRTLRTMGLKCPAAVDDVMEGFRGQVTREEVEIVARRIYSKPPPMKPPYQGGRVNPR